jgi:hypothetical protein
MTQPIDENAIAQLVAKILAESLRGADVPATEPPMSIPGFCRSEGMSRASFYALKRKGMAPELTEIILPGEPGINRGRGLKLVRISAQSRRAWREKIAQVRASEAVELEIARAREQQVAVAKLAAISPNYVSKNRARPGAAAPTTRRQKPLIKAGAVWRDHCIANHRARTSGPRNVDRSNRLVVVPLEKKPAESDSAKREIEVVERSISSQMFGHRDDVAHVLFRDYETRGVLALDNVGVHRYAADPQTEVLCCAFAVDDQPVKLWKPGDPIPLEFREAASSQNWITAAHYAPFEIGIEELLLGPRYGFPLIPLEQHRCTLAMASALALPGKLEKLADVLELAHRKDVAGHRLMLAMSKPRRARKGENPNEVHWFDDHERLQRLYAYSMRDIEVERELYLHLLALPPSEQAIWCLDATVNARGFYLDQQLACVAAKIAAAAVPKINTELAEVTGGAVTGVNQIAGFQAWYGRRAASSTV